MLELLVSAVGGGGLGILGSLANRLFGIWEKQQEHKRDQERRIAELQIEQELAQIEANSALAVAEENANAVALRADADARIASYRHDTDGGQASQWVIDTLRLVRPAITLPLVCALIYAGLVLGVQEAALALVFLANMVVGWWFGDRSPNRSASAQ